jgi:hypothetical protein
MDRMGTIERRRGARSLWATRGPALAVAIAAALWASASTGQSPTSPGEAPSEGGSSDAIVVPRTTGDARSPEGDPGLDALLQLPSSYSMDEPDAVAGANEKEWRRRFVKAESALATARDQLEATRAELDSVAGEGGSSQWSIAPPGSSSGDSTTNSPMSFKLRQQLREDRERIEKLEKALRELRIEADLAGVPQHWRVAQSEAP